MTPTNRLARTAWMVRSRRNGLYLGPRGAHFVGFEDARIYGSTGAAKNSAGKGRRLRRDQAFLDFFELVEVEVTLHV